jgi:hypothetical protein
VEEDAEDEGDDADRLEADLAAALTAHSTRFAGWRRSIGIGPIAALIALGALGSLFARATLFARGWRLRQCCGFFARESRSRLQERGLLRLVGPGRGWWFVHGEIAVRAHTRWLWA